MRREKKSSQRVQRDRRRQEHRWLRGKDGAKGESIKSAVKRLLKFRVAKTAKAAILGKK